MKFKIKNKGFISQGFSANPDLYEKRGTPGHTGVDYVKGYGSLHQADNTGYVYKVFLPQERPDNWVGVYSLVRHGMNYMEVCTGHYSSVFVKEGEMLMEGEFIGLEGNNGYIVAGGTVITPEMQDKGDRRGSHCHESYRPVRKVKRKTEGKFYLEAKDGSSYKDSDGYFYEIIYTNVMKGYIDPMQFVYTDTVADKIRSILNALMGLKT